MNWNYLENKSQHDMKMGELVENIIRETISKKRP